MFLAGFPIIAFMHLVSHIFDKHMTGFKYALLVTMGFVIVLIGIQEVLYISKFFVMIIDVVSPFFSLFKNMSDILSFTG